MFGVFSRNTTLGFSRTAGEEKRTPASLNSEKLRAISHDMVLPNNLEWIDELPDDSSEQILDCMEENDNEGIIMGNGNAYVDQEAFIEAVITLEFVYNLDEED